MALHIPYPGGFKEVRVETEDFYLCWAVTSLIPLTEMLIKTIQRAWTSTPMQQKTTLLFSSSVVRKGLVQTQEFDHHVTVMSFLFPCVSGSHMGNLHFPSPLVVLKWCTPFSCQSTVLDPKSHICKISSYQNLLVISRNKISN